MTVESKMKPKMVEVCSICEEHDILITGCDVCGKRVCRKHGRYTVPYKPKMEDSDGYAWGWEHLRVCSECQQKPFIEIWDFINSLGYRVW